MHSCIDCGSYYFPGSKRLTSRIELWIKDAKNPCFFTEKQLREYFKESIEKGIKSYANYLSIIKLNMDLEGLLIKDFNLHQQVIKYAEQQFMPNLLFIWENHGDESFYPQGGWKFYDE